MNIKGFNVSKDIFDLIENLKCCANCINYNSSISFCNFFDEDVKPYKACENYWEWDKMTASKRKE